MDCCRVLSNLSVPRRRIAALVGQVRLTPKLRGLAKKQDQTESFACGRKSIIGENQEYFHWLFGSGRAH
eukprot:scaffold655_cov162-Amphora_coffeaeformis.AAC.24